MIEMPILRPVPTPLEIAAAEGRKLGFRERIKAWWETNRKWEVMEDWQYENAFFTPKGFIFDGASIPRFLWWFLNPVGVLLIPGLVHDNGYKFGGSWPRKHWDDLFRMVTKEVTGLTVIPWIAWAAVRLGGWRAWKEHRKNDKISQTAN